MESYLYKMDVVFPDGKKKAVTLSYDDGVMQDKRFINIINKYGFKATFNVNSFFFGAHGANPRIKKEEIKDTYSNGGHEVAVHGAAHAYPNRIPSNIMVRDVIDDRKNLEKIFLHPIRGMAYAFGKYNADTLLALKAAKMAYSRTTKSTHEFGVFHGDEWHCLNPTAHHNDPKLLELCDQFLESKQNGLMFYLWGHTYEFDRDDNWDVIEKFCEKMGGRDDIWYATNIDIHDYIDAYDRLIVSMDGLLVSNPSSIPVWVNAWVRKDEKEEKEKIYKINPGETCVLK